MTCALPIAIALAAVGCICNAHCETDFSAVCVERGGQVRVLVRDRKQCVAADGGVVAVWAEDDDDGGEP